jgi:hypothetical protein
MEVNTRTTLIAGIVVGLILGLLLGVMLFWWLFPVEWTNGQSYDLSPEAKAEYVALVADSYMLDMDYERASGFLQRWTYEEKQQAFADAVGSYEAGGQTDKAQAVQDLALLLGVTEAPPPPPDTGPGIVDRVRVPCLVFVVVLLVLVVVWIGARMLMKPKVAEDAPMPAARFQPAVPQADEEWEDVERPPLGHFATTYRLGEDTYDESFSIDTPMGEFLGECGVGISETIGATEPDKVTAFEVWLFDKSDIRTVTKVLMSDYAFQDESLRAKLASKGEAVLAQPNAPFSLQTSGLEVRVNVTELEYAEEDPTLGSFFSKLTVELEALARPAASDASML